MASVSPSDPDEVTISADGSPIGGWEMVEVTRGAEIFPNSFLIGASVAPAGGTLPKVGDPCSIRLGDDLVITGYLDRYTEGGNATSHSVMLDGRGKTQDLVDCSAEWDSGQIASATVLDIATKLTKPYGISVKLAEGAKAGDPAPQFNLTYGETPAEIIQRLARNAALLAYEDETGALLLAKLGSSKAGSAIKYGENVEAWSTMLSIDQRYSLYRAAASAINVTGDVQGGDDSFFYSTQPDSNVKRHRLLYFPPEAAVDTRVFTPKKIIWEAARRAGRSIVVRVTVTGWRDGSGKLWAPNTRVEVTVPGLPAATELCVSEVTYRRNNETGTTADLLLMPPLAFLPEPISLQTTNLNDVTPGGGT